MYKRYEVLKGTRYEINYNIILAKYRKFSKLFRFIKELYPDAYYYRQKKRLNSDIKTYRAPKIFFDKERFEITFSSETIYYKNSCEDAGMLYINSDFFDKTEFERSKVKRDALPKEGLNPIISEKIEGIKYPNEPPYKYSCQIGLLNFETICKVLEFIKYGDINKKNKLSKSGQNIINIIIGYNTMQVNNNKLEHC